MKMNKWTAFRVLVISFGSWSIMYYPQSQSNIDWIACILIAGVTSIFLFGWLVFDRKRNVNDWGAPFSMTSPFWPMIKYPARYWIVTSLVMMLGGVGAMVKSIGSDGSNLAFGGTFLFMGIGILTSVLLVLRMP